MTPPCILQPMILSCMPFFPLVMFRIALWSHTSWFPMAVNVGLL